MTAGIVTIHGREYKTVAYRVGEFREDHGIDGGWAIITDELPATNHMVKVFASIVDPEGKVVATGLAEEDREKGQINKTSALENCETSAIGRALAAAGYGGSEYASANEVENAIHQQDTPEPRTSAPTTEVVTPDTGKFRAAVADLVSRGAAAIEKVENVNPKLALDEMQSKKVTVLGHEGYERVDEITHRPAQLEFYAALEETVKALEAKAE